MNKGDHDWHGPTASGEGRRPHRRSYWDARLRKQQEQAVIARSSILSSCIIYFDGRATDLGISAFHLSREAQANGAIVVPFFNRRVTHVICTSLAHSKIAKELRRRVAMRQTAFVKGEWLLDSIQQGARLPEQLYTILEHVGQQQTIQQTWHPACSSIQQTNPFSDAYKGIRTLIQCQDHAWQHFLSTPAPDLTIEPLSTESDVLVPSSETDIAIIID